MTAWRNQSFWSKTGVWAWLAFMAVFTSYTDAGWMAGGSSIRKRVFSPGFILLCAFVAVYELVALNHFHRSQIKLGRL